MTGQQAERVAIADDRENVETDRQAIAKALRLLPRMPARVALIDARDARPDVQATLLRLDAFVVRGSPTVYVVRQSELLKSTARGVPFTSTVLLPCCGTRWRTRTDTVSARLGSKKRRSGGRPSSGTSVSIL